MEASNTPRMPKIGETWRSRDKRDDGLLVTVLVVARGYVLIQRFNKTAVKLSRWHRDYEPVDA